MSAENPGDEDPKVTILRTPAGLFLQRFINKVEGIIDLSHLEIENKYYDNSSPFNPGPITEEKMLELNEQGDLD